MDRILKSILSETERGREWLRQEAAAKRAKSARRSSRSPRATGVDKAAKREERADRTAEVRAACVARAGVVSWNRELRYCDCGCGRVFFPSRGHMDHWIGGSSRQEMTTVANCWLLYWKCDADKTEMGARGRGTVEEWNEKRRAFCERHGLDFIPRKPTRYFARARREEETHG